MCPAGRVAMLTRHFSEVAELNLLVDPGAAPECTSGISDEPMNDPVEALKAIDDPVEALKAIDCPIW